MTYRERRLARAERLRGWAEKREASASATFAEGERYRGDIAFATQPGRIPERDRLNRREARAFESLEKAERMSSRADSIERAAANAIYSDDDDAIPRLAAKIEKLEAERARIVAYNRSARKAAKTGGTGDLSLLDERQKRDLLSTMKSCPYFIGPGGTYPSYATSNLSGNLSRLRKRLALLERRAAR